MASVVGRKQVSVFSRIGVSLEIRRSRFSGTRFISSPAGILKILETGVFLLGAVLFMLSSCIGVPDWYDWLYPAVTLTAIGCITITYIIYIMGVAKTTHTFCMVDILMNIAIAVAVLICTILTLTEKCQSKQAFEEVPVPAGFVGAGLLVTSAAVTYIFLRWEQQEDEALRAPSPHPNQRPTAFDPTLTGV